MKVLLNRNDLWHRISSVYNILTGITELLSYLSLSAIDCDIHCYKINFKLTINNLNNDKEINDALIMTRITIAGASGKNLGCQIKGLPMKY